jgi:hypothetical protein
VAPDRAAGWENASLPSLLHGRKKIALTVQYSGFAAFGHPARQSSLATGHIERAGDTGGLRPLAGRNDALHGREAEPADAPLKDDRNARDRLFGARAGAIERS